MLQFKLLGLLIFLLTLLVSESKRNPETGDHSDEDEKGSTVNPDKCLEEVAKYPKKLEKYQYLRNLQNENEDKFYSCLIQHVNDLLPIVYTPVVGEVCQNYGKITGPKRGITLAITEKNKMEEKLKEWRKKHPETKAIVVTDGGRILGLGDLGANGMGIPVGKMAIYSALGGVHPKYCLPITLDVGTDNEKLRTDPNGLYVGLKQAREKGEDYDVFVEQFMTTAINVFGSRTLIQFEDFANENAFKFLVEYGKRYTVFNDDIQGTAAVALAGILAAERFADKKLKDAKILFVGAGEAGVGIANLLVSAMKEVGVSEEAARKKIFMKRSQKLIMEGDTYSDKDDRRLYRKSPRDMPKGANIADLLEIVRWLKPNILIGVSGKGGLFTKEILEMMGKNHDAPIIFPLSNPEKNSECTADEAYKYTQGKALFASGSPFDEVKYNGKRLKPKQCNNAYIFPGIALAVIATQMKSVTENVFLIAAKTLARTCTQQEDFDEGSLFPKLEKLRECSVEIATEIAKYAFQENLATVTPPPDIKQFILDHQYKPSGLP